MFLYFSLFLSAGSGTKLQTFSNVITFSARLAAIAGVTLLIQVSIQGNGISN
ncbi:MAG TPA: hypothetical protein VF610_10545 [Segetibacter sp.]